MSQWLDTLQQWLTTHPEWLGLAIFVIALLECLAIVGILLPGVLLLFSTALLAGSGALPLWQVLLLAWLGALIGDSLSYGLGRRFQNNIPQLPIIRRHPQWIVTAQLHFQRYGTISLLVGRFIGPLRPMLPLVAGMLAMPFPRFMAVSMISAAGWAVVYLLPGWTTGAALRLPMPEGFWLQAGILTAGLMLIVILSAQASLNKKRYASLLAGLLCLLALVGLTIGWPCLDALDNGLISVVQEQRRPSLDRLMNWITQLGDWRTQFASCAILIVSLLAFKARRAAIFACLAMLGTALCNTLLKHLFTRARPDILLEPLSSFSFPSGHSSASFAFFLVLGILAGRGQSPRTRLTWLLLACVPATLIALSRIYLGAHWPTDIMAGGILAATLCALSLALIQRHQPLPAPPARLWWWLLPGCLSLMLFLASWYLPEALLWHSY